MTNFTFNNVTIKARPEEVGQRLIDADDGSYRFNLHKVFPEQFGADDPLGLGDRMQFFSSLQDAIDDTGPVIQLSAKDGATRLQYDTARVPNNGVLIRLHELTGWTIRSRFVEESLDFRGQLVCKDGRCEELPREEEHCCNICLERFPASQLSEMPSGDLHCPRCHEIHLEQQHESP